MTSLGVVKGGVQDIHMYKLHLDWQARTMPYEDSFIVVGGRDDVNDVEPVIDIFVGYLLSD